MSFTPPVGDATSSTKGIVRLTGDLGGTAASPTVPGLSGKANSSHTHAASDIISGTVSYALMPASTTLTVVKSAGVWPARPTSRSDIVVQWKGPDPSPSIVSSGTGGMLDNVDIRLITP
jgi:hypothetical protein